MGDKEGNNPGHDYVSDDLCKARMETSDAKLNGLKMQIIGAIGLSTAIIVTWMWLLKP